MRAALAAVLCLLLVPPALGQVDEHGSLDTNTTAGLAQPAWTVGELGQAAAPTTAGLAFRAGCRCNTLALMHC